MEAKAVIRNNVYPPFLCHIECFIVTDQLVMRIDIRRARENYRSFSHIPILG